MNSAYAVISKLASGIRVCCVVHNRTVLNSKIQSGYSHLIQQWWQCLSVESMTVSAAASVLLEQLSYIITVPEQITGVAGNDNTVKNAEWPLLKLQCYDH